MWKIYAIDEVNNFLSIKAFITTKIRIAKEKGIKTVPVKWVFNSKEDPDGLIHMNSGNVVKGYMQVTGVDFTDSLSPVTSDTPMRTMIGINL